MSHIDKSLNALETISEMDKRGIATLKDALSQARGIISHTPELHPIPLGHPMEVIQFKSGESHNADGPSFKTSIISSDELNGGGESIEVEDDKSQLTHDGMNDGDEHGDMSDMSRYVDAQIQVSITPTSDESDDGNAVLPNNHVNDTTLDYGDQDDKFSEDEMLNDDRSPTHSPSKSDVIMTRSKTPKKKEEVKASL